MNANDTLLAAAKVIQRDQRIRRWLTSNDPKALQQLDRAIAAVDPIPWSLTDHNTLPIDDEPIDKVVAMLDGKEWNADTCAEIATLLVNNGYIIREFEPSASFDPNAPSDDLREALEDIYGKDS